LPKHQRSFGLNFGDGHELAALAEVWVRSEANRVAHRYLLPR
jgi:hypothetical protein